MADPASPPSKGQFGFGLGLVLIAGWIDAVGFIHLRGRFVSFMSGNTTQAAVATAQLGWAEMLPTLQLIGMFVLGVVTGELLGDASGTWRRMSVLGLEAALLAVATALLLTTTFMQALIPLLGLAMGVQNAALFRTDAKGMPLTYVTGALVSFGRSLALALRGRGGWTSCRDYAAIWLALAFGAVGGALATQRSQWGAIAAAMAACLLLLLVAGAQNVATRRRFTDRSDA